MKQDAIANVNSLQRQARGLILFAASLLLAVWAQRSLAERTFVFDGVLFYVVALFVFFLALRPFDGLAAAPASEAPADEIERPASALPEALRRPLLVLACVFGLVAFLSLGNNAFSPQGVAAWMIACAVLLAASCKWPARSWWSAKFLQMQGELGVPWPWVVLTLVILVGAFFRFYHISTIPADMTSDHIEKLLDVKDILDGKRPIFFARNAGREAIMFYWTAFWSTIFGFGFWTLKFSAALAGLAVVPAVFLLAREFFDSRVGLVAAFFVAVSKWHVNISRIGLRYPFASLASALAMLFLYRALRSNRRSDWVIAGLLTGLGQFGYTSMRVMPLVFVVCLLAKLIWDRNFGPGGLTALIQNVSLSAVAAILAFIPMARYAYDFPQMFLFRTLTRATSAERPLPGNLVLAFLDNLKNSLLAFNWKGDVSWLADLPNDPFLDVVTGALFVLGIGCLLWLIIRYRDVRPVYLIAAFIIFLLPSTMALAFPIENPSASRASAAIPMVAIIVALPVSVFIAYIRRVLTGAGGIVLIVMVLVALAAVVAQLNYRTYFVDYDQAYRASAPNASEVGRVVKPFADGLGDLNHVYMITYPYWLDHRVAGLVAGNIAWNNLLDSADKAREQANDPSGKMYIVNVADKKSLDTLQSIYPNGLSWTYKSAEKKDFVLFFVPAAR